MNDPTRDAQVDIAHPRPAEATVAARRQRTTSRAPRGRAPGVAGVAGVEGWRAWRLADVGGSPRLQSISARDIWDGPCFTSDELPAAARRGGRSGIHAYATPAQMRSALYGAALVYGQVTLHGEVCVHDIGYRAEHARIDRLFLRACGKHPPRFAAPTGMLLIALLNHEPGSYCSCDALAPHEWMSYEQLEELAGQLGDRYQCEVIVDVERARVPTHACSQRRHSRDIRARGV